MWCCFFLTILQNEILNNDSKRSRPWVAIVRFQKISNPPQEKSLEIPRRGGISKAKFFKGKYEAKLEIPWGGGWGEFKPKTFCVGEGGYFLEPHIVSVSFFQDPFIFVVIMIGLTAVKYAIISWVLKFRVYMLFERHSNLTAQKACGFDCSSYLC